MDHDGPGIDWTLIGAAAGAAVIRAATYSGAPRPWKQVVADLCVQLLVSYAAANAAEYATDSWHAAVAAGIISGVVGWEVIKWAVIKKVSRQLK